VPAHHGAIDALAFAVAYRAGRPLSRSVARETPPEFFARLDSAVREMHARGVVHLDLRHQGNVLVGDDGAPVLIDFGSALVLRPGGAAARIACALLGWIDHRAVAKWRAYSGAGGAGAGDASAGIGDGASSRSSRGESRAT
jgi:serine/threonine protein kinase